MTAAATRSAGSLSASASAAASAAPAPSAAAVSFALPVAPVSRPASLGSTGDISP